MNFVICKCNRLQTYLLTNLIINLMVLVDKENVKGYVQMDEKEHTKKEYASKGLAGTALGLGIGGLAVSLLNNGCNPLGIFGRNCGTNAGEVAIAANNYIGKLDGLLKAIEDKDGKVDIEGILSESIDNLVVAQVKKYPNVLSGVEIGGGTIKINIPSFDKQLVFDYNDIETFKQNILN